MEKVTHVQSEKVKKNKMLSTNTPLLSKKPVISNQFSTLMDEHKVLEENNNTKPNVFSPVNAR